MPKRLLVATLAALALATAACGNTLLIESSNPRDSAQASPSPTSNCVPPVPVALAPVTVDVPVQPPTPGQKPTVTIPATDPPPALEVKDLTVGGGDVAVSCDNLKMNYLGVSWSTSKVFDNSFDRGQTFDFQLGSGNVIRGWDQGIVGMKVGGRRLLIIPPDLGYGPQGAGGDIGPNETLVFVVDLVSVG